MGAVKREIRRRLPYNDVYGKAEWAARSRGYWIESTGLGLTLFLTVTLGALVGVVIVAQTLYSSTIEHLVDFGTVKALGGGNLTVYAIVAEQCFSRPPWAMLWPWLWPLAWHLFCRALT